MASTTPTPNTGSNGMDPAGMQGMPAAPSAAKTYTNEPVTKVDLGALHRGPGSE